MGEHKNINKVHPASLQHRGATYVTAPSVTINLVRNPVALAIWLYLLDRPENWIVRRRQIMDTFSLGRDRYDAAMKELRRLGLVWTEIDRGPGGQITGTRLCVNAEPLPSKPDIRKTNNTVKSATSDNPGGGHSGHLNRTNSLNNTNICEAAQKRKAPKRKSTKDTTIEQDLMDTSWAR